MSLSSTTATTAPSSLSTNTTNITTNNNNNSALSHARDGAATVRRYCLPHSSVGSDVRCAVRVLVPPAEEDEDEGDRFRSDAHRELRVEAFLFALGAPLHASAADTRVGRRADGTGRRRRSAVVWNETLEFPARWRDLPRDAALGFEVVDDGARRRRAAYATTLPLFDGDGALRQGTRKLLLHPDARLHVPAGAGAAGRTPGCDPRSAAADGGDLRRPLPRPGEAVDAGYGPRHEAVDPAWRARAVLDRVEGRRRDHAPHEPVPWLDALTAKRCRDVLDADARGGAYETPTYDDDDDDGPVLLPYPSVVSPEERTVRSNSFLVVELPTHPAPVVHEEVLYPHAPNGASGSVTALDLDLHHRAAAVRGAAPDDKPFALGVDEDVVASLAAVVRVLDHETTENDDAVHHDPVEDKYRALHHDVLRGALVDPTLKPDRRQRARIDAVVHGRDAHRRALTHEERDLLWRFRFSLVDDHRALNKFLLAVDWTEESEVVQAAELLEQWRRRSPIGVADALLLLGKNVSFRTSLVRSYAVDALSGAPDDELRSYLLQLVQALRYEDDDYGDGAEKDKERDEEKNDHDHATSSSSSSSSSSLADFLVDRARRSPRLANDLYWYVKVETQNPANAERYANVMRSLREELSKVPYPDGNDKDDDRDGKRGGGGGGSGESIFPSLIASDEEEDDDDDKTTTSSSVASSFFGSVTHKLNSSFGGGNNASSVPRRTRKKRRSVWDVLTLQDRLVSAVMDCQRRARDLRVNKDEKQVALRKYLAESQELDRYSKSRDNTVPLPTDPDVVVAGIVRDTAFMFKSALYPAVVEFVVDESTSHKVIVKTGDDLRQDQLVIMMIRLMNGILKRYTLDLCLRSFSIIATAPDTGLVEFVPGSLTIFQILGEFNNSILLYFRHVAPDPTAPNGVRPDVVSTFIRSCAGYCVITYLLGVGDRHLENIMLLPSGHLFHIDFGFIFGRDPKPLPPPFRLTKEMVAAMGGPGSRGHATFKSLACQAYNLLRKEAGLILNLLHLMADAGIRDLGGAAAADDPTDAVLARVEERFRLGLTDERAEAFFSGLMDDSLAAIAPRVMDVFHSFAVARR